MMNKKTTLAFLCMITAHCLAQTPTYEILKQSTTEPKKPLSFTVAAPAKKLSEGELTECNLNQSMLHFYKRLREQGGAEWFTDDLEAKIKALELKTRHCPPKKGLTSKKQ